MTNFRYGANVQANGIRQHYLRYGESSGPCEPLILIPGITSPAVTWGFVGERLGSSFDTYIPDVRGRGLSESGPWLDYGLDAMASDVLALAEALSFDRFSILGHSMGARIAVRAAATNPEPISHIVLIDPPVSGPARRPYPSPIRAYLDPIEMARAGHLSLDHLRATFPSWTDKQLRTRAEWLHTCDERAVIVSHAGFHDDDIHGDLKSLSVPTLLLTAEHGDVVRDDEISEIRASNSFIQTRRVADAGHMIPWDNEPGFFACLEDFFGVSFAKEVPCP